MNAMVQSLLAAEPILGALITWTVEAFYIAVAVVHFVAILAGFKLLQADTDNNLFAGAVVVAIATGAAGYMTRDMGLTGLLITGSTLFVSLLLISAGDALRSLALTGVCVVVYAGLGHFMIPYTPLSAESIGGFTSAFIDGLNEEPIGNEKDLYEHTRKKRDEALGE